MAMATKNVPKKALHKQLATKPKMVVKAEPEEELDLNLADDGEELAEEELEDTPPPKPKKPQPIAVKSNGNGSDLDRWGFGTRTVASFVMHYLVDGCCTRKELQTAFMGTEFHAWGRGQEVKRNKTSLTVFLSDVRKPFGQYHSSRSLIINEDPETHKLSVDTKRLAAIEKAVAAGILGELRGLNIREHLPKLKVIRKKYGMPLE
jgi:hypothetical protein